MSFSKAAAANVVPLLSRVVLAGLLVPMGWTMLTAQSTYRGSDLEWLQKLGVIESPESALASLRTVQDGSGAATVPPAAEPASGAGSDDTTPPVVGSGVVEPADPQPTEIQGDASDRIPGEEPMTEGPTTEPIPGDEEGVEARRLYGFAVAFAEAGWPKPTVLAWSFAFLMLVGGSLLVLGLVTRLWALLVAAAFGGLFWIDSWPVVAEHWMIGLDDAAFVLIAAQAAVTCLAVGLVFSGGGWLSLDHAIGRRGESAATFTDGATG